MLRTPPFAHLHGDTCPEPQEDPPRVKTRLVQTNPVGPEWTQCISVLCGWEQVQQEVLPALLDSTPNKQELHIILCTLKYLYETQRCGILVLLRQGRVRLFAPFVNPSYTNPWSDRLDTSLLRDAPRDTRGWWCNGSLLCTKAAPNLWGDTHLAGLKHMLVTLCRTRDMEDHSFFLNKRDHPQLRKDRQEPWFPASAHTRSVACAYRRYSPIFSFFTGPDFEDIAVPTTDDWEIATRKLFPPHYNAARQRLEDNVPWEAKRPCAFFRGAATGSPQLATNQRLQLAQLSYLARLAGEDWIDAGVTSWNRRIKVEGCTATGRYRARALGPMPFPLVERVPMAVQSQWRYLLYVQGHEAAARYSALMCLGSCILKVRSTVPAPNLWFFADLRGFVIGDKEEEVTDEDHVVVDSVQDVQKTVLWLREHDRVAERVAANALRKAREWFTVEHILKTWQRLLQSVPPAPCVENRCQGLRMLPRSQTAPEALHQYVK